MQHAILTKDTLIFDLSDGCTSIPLVWYPRTWHETPEESEYWHLIEQREDIRWPDLYEDISVDNLVLGKPSGESQRSFKLRLEARTTPSEQT